MDKHEEIDSELSTIKHWALGQLPYSILITTGEDHDEYDRNQIPHINEEFIEITRYTEDEILSEKPKTLQGEKTHQHIMDHMSDWLEGVQHFVGETINHRKDGSEYAIGIAIDTTEHDGFTHWLSIRKQVSDDPLTNGFSG